MKESLIRFCMYFSPLFTTAAGTDTCGCAGVGSIAEMLGLH